MPIPGNGAAPHGESLELSAFVATRYSDPQRLAFLTSPAYDLIEPSEREDLANSDEHSIVHLTLPTFGADDAKRRLLLWRQEHVLVPDPEPALFVYDMAEPSAGPAAMSTRGWIASVTLVPPGSAAVSPHEATLPEPVADRLRLLAATQANLEPIVLTHDGAPALADALAHRCVTEGPPIIDLLDDAGIRHRIWRVSDPTQIEAVRLDFATRHAVIADGHHRYASYLDYQALQHATAAGPGPWDRGLALLVPTDARGPRVRAIHRVVPDLPLNRAVLAASSAFRTTSIGPLSASQADDLLARALDTAVLLTDGTDWVVLTDPDRAPLLGGTPPELAAAWWGLDTALVDAGLIDSLWAASGTVMLRHSTGSAIDTARERTGVAVLVRPTSAAMVLDIAARGILMPRKSTFFVPKPRTGLVLRCFVDEIDYPAAGSRP